MARYVALLRGVRFMNFRMPDLTACMPRRRVERTSHREGAVNGGIESWGPSLTIAASTAAAFAIGRILAWLGARWPRVGRLLRIVVPFVALLAAVYFLVTPSSRYALLLPAAFVLAFLSYGHTRIAPGVFRP